MACDAPITGILDYDTHPGAYDIMIPAGEPIYAASDGEVQGVVIQDSGSLGVELIHPRADGRTYMSQYFHMSRFIPGMAAGDMVVEGQLIGFTGSTGAMNSHVHFDFSDRTVGYVKLDPRPLFRATRLASTGYVDGPSGHNLPATAIIGRCPPGTSGYE